MTEKVKLPKEVCDALDNFRKDLEPAEILYYFFRKYDGPMTYDMTVLEDVESDDLMRAMVLGYEPEMSSEEATIKSLFRDIEKTNLDCTAFYAYRCGIRDALHTHGIYYDWIDDAK